MAEPRHNDDSPRRNNESIETPDPQQRRDESLQEGESVRGSSDDEGVDIDPDSADADIDRDDSVTD